MVMVNENITATVMKRPFDNEYEAAFSIIYGLFVVRHPIINFYSFAFDSGT